MFKKIGTLILVIILISSSSCSLYVSNESQTSTHNNEISMTFNDLLNNDSFLYANVNGVIYKYSIKEGYAIPLCNDPLCKHSDSACQFYGIGDEIYKIDDKIIYYKNTNLFQYDIENNKTTNLVSANGKIYYAYLIQNKIYYNTVNFDYSPNAEHTSRVNLYYYDLEDKTVVQLNSTTLYDMQILQGVKDNRLVWYDNGLHNLYTSNFEYQDIIDMNGEYYGIMTGNMSYRLEVCSTSPLSFNLYYTDNDSKKIVLKNIVSVKGYEESLIVTFNKQNGKYIGDTITDDGKVIQIYEYQDTELYKYDASGKNKSLICKLPEDYIIYSLAPTKGTLSYGNYIGIQLKEYIYDSNGYVLGYQISPNIAIVNYITGEYIITKTK